MAAQIKVYLADADAADDLREWMNGLSGIVVEAAPRRVEPNAQGSVWDFLSVLCASAGPVVAAVRAIQLWIESRVTIIEIVVGNDKFTVKTANASSVLPHVTAAATRMLESGGEGSDDAA